MLSRLAKQINFQEINWCEYIISRLRFCKNTWSGRDDKEFFSGPMTTLVLMYVDSIKCDVPPVRRVKPAIKAWSSELLKMRVEAETELGGLGVADFAEPYDENQENEDEVEMTDVVPQSPVRIEEYLSLLDDTHNQLVSLKTKFNTALDKACLKFPEEASLDDWRTKQLDFVLVEQQILETQQWNVQVNEDGGEGGNEDEGNEEGGIEESGKGGNEGNNEGGGEARLEEVTEEGEESETEEEREAKNIDNLVARLSIDNPENTTEGNTGEKEPSAVKSSQPSFSLGLTQLFGEDSQKTGEDVTEKVVTKTVGAEKDVTEKIGMGEEVMEKEKEQEPSKQNLTVKLKVNKEKMKETEKECITPDPTIRGRRELKAAMPMCSPYLDRKVDINAQLTKDEKMVAHWMFAKLGDKMDGVFKTITGGEAPRMVFESMAQETAINASIIDIWSVILNNEEQFRNNSSPHRLFFTTTTMTEEMLEMEKEKMMAAFTSSMEASMTNINEMASLKNVDMLFFPMRKSTHYYLIVFNLKDPSFVILDNSSTDVPIDVKYGKVPNVLKKTLLEYMKVVKHPRVNSMTKVKPNRYRMKWRTKENFIDCGIFVMRHMETYKGETVSKYDCGLDKEFGGQDGQLQKLRNKYLCKILLSSMNTLKYKVISQSTAFSKIDGKITKKLIQEVRLR